MVKAEVMTTEEVERIRARSKAGKEGPWVTDWNEMAKKTVFRRLSKWLPLSAEYRDAVDKDDDVLDAVARPVDDAPTSLDSLADSLAHVHDEPEDMEPLDVTPDPVTEEIFTE